MQQNHQRASPPEPGPKPTAPTNGMVRDQQDIQYKTNNRSNTYSNTLTNCIFMAFVYGTGFNLCEFGVFCNVNGSFVLNNEF